MIGGKAGEVMVDMNNERTNMSGSNNSVDPASYGDMPEGGYARHPLFPREDNGPESRDIQFVSFRRRRTDGRADNCAEDIPAHLIHSWAQVQGPWGGGEYKAMAKDSHHRIVAWAPEKPGEWMLFDGPSKPFTVRGEPYSPPPALGEPAAVFTGAPPPARLASPPTPPPPDPVMSDVLRQLHELRTAVASVQAPPPAPPSPPPPPTPTHDPAMIELIKSQGELLRTVLSAALTPRPVESSAKPSADPMAMAIQIMSVLRPEPAAKASAEPMTMAIQLLGAIQKFAPHAQGQGTVTDRLGEYRAIRDLTAPSAPPAPQSEFGDMKDLLMSMMQADALSKSTRDVMPPPPVPERRQAPPPPPPIAPLQYVQGLGMVRVEQPEEPPPRTAERALDYEALQRDPRQRQRMLQALGLDRAFEPAPAATAVPLSHAPMSTTPSTPVAVESTSVVSTAPAASVPVGRLDSTLDLRVDAERGPVAPTTPIAMAPAPVVVDEDLPRAPREPRPVSPPERAPLEVAPAIETAPPIEIAPPIEVATASIVADERIPIALPERMPVAEPQGTTELELERARVSFVAMLKLPPERLRSALRTLPGANADVEGLMGAIGAIPEAHWPVVLRQLPAEMVRALGDLDARTASPSGAEPKNNDHSGRT